MFKCSLCNKEFSRQFNLKRHALAVHRSCALCLEKINHWITHTCRRKPLNEGLDNGQTLYNSYNEDEVGDEVDYHADDDDEAEYHADDEVDDEAGDDDDEGSMDEGSDQETDILAEEGMDEGSNHETDIFTEDDEDLESDASVTDSESEEEEDRGEEVESDNTQSDTIFLQWPNKTLYLKCRWMKYGSGKFKLIQHHKWLSDLSALNYARSLRAIRHASPSELESLCEIAMNLLLANVYPYNADVTFLTKNKGLIRGLASSNVSIERKRRLIIQRGADFIRRIAGIVHPLIVALEEDFNLSDF